MPAKGSAKHSIDLWIMDTGCGHDLVSIQAIRNLVKLIQKARRANTLYTANDRTPATDVIDLFVKELGETVEPYVLASTPAVLSVGLRCMEMGSNLLTLYYRTAPL